MPLAKYGTPEWKSIAQTRSAQIKTMFEVTCPKCDADGCELVIYLCESNAAALAAVADHNLSHSTTLAECCMWASDCVCSCGNVLV